MRTTYDQDEEFDEDEPPDLCDFCQDKKVQRQCLACTQEMCKQCADGGLCPDCAVNDFQ